MDDVYVATSRALARGLEVGLKARQDKATPEQSGCAKQDTPIFTFDNVKTYDELVQSGRAEGQINKYVVLSNESAKAFGKEKNFAGYVGIQVVRTEAGHSLFVWLFGNAPKGGGLQELDRRAISGGVSETELLQLANDMGYRIGFGCQKQPPHLDIAVRGKALAKPGKNGEILLLLGDEIELDASASQDPDFDELSWHWHCRSGQPCPEPLPKDGGSRRPKLHLKPRQAGVYELCVRVSKVADAKAATDDCPEDPGTRKLILKVGEAPRVEPDQSRYLEMNAASLRLTTYCDSQTSDCQFKQMTGPFVKDAPEWPDNVVPNTFVWRAEGATDGPTKEKDVGLTRPGLYTYLFTASNEFGTKTQTWTVMLAPLPEPVLDAPELIFSGNVGLLNAGGSSDPLRQPLEYTWNIEWKTDASGAEIPTPKTSSATLRAPNDGMLELSLCVEAPRQFEGQERRGMDCREKTIEIVTRRLELSAGGRFRGVVQNGVQFGFPLGISFAPHPLVRFSLYQVFGNNVAYKTDSNFEFSLLGGTSAFVGTRLWHNEKIALRPQVGLDLRTSDGFRTGLGVLFGLDSAFAVNARTFLSFRLNGGYGYYAALSTPSAPELRDTPKWQWSSEASLAFGVNL